MKRLMLIGLLIGTVPAVFCNESAEVLAADKVKKLEEENKAFKEEKERAEQVNRVVEEDGRRLEVMQNAEVAGCVTSLLGIVVSTTIGAELFGEKGALSCAVLAGLFSGIAGCIKSHRAEVALEDKQDVSQGAAHNKSVMKTIYDQGFGHGLVMGPFIGLGLAGLAGWLQTMSQRIYDQGVNHGWYRGYQACSDNRANEALGFFSDIFI